MIAIFIIFFIWARKKKKERARSIEYQKGDDPKQVEQ